MADFSPAPYEVRRAIAPPTIDGDPGDVAWKSAELIEPFFAYQSGGDPPAADTTLRMLWDDSFLYVLIEAEDQDIRSACALNGNCSNDSALFNGDVLELFIRESTGRTLYHEFEWSPDDLYFDAKFQTRFGAPGTSWESSQMSSSSVSGTLDNPSDTDLGWTTEAAIPLAAFTLVPAAEGVEWTFTGARYDYFNRSQPGGPALMMSTRGDPDAPSGGVTNGFHTYEIYDRMRFVGTVPEPTNIILLAAASGLLACCRHRRTTLCLSLLATSLSFAASSQGEAAEAGDRHQPIVLGYYPEYEGFAAEDIPWDKLTHLCHAFITSDPQGRIQPNERVPNAKLTAMGKQHGVPVILSVGGWGDADGFEQATSTPQKMATWVDAITQIVIDNGYAGLDVDWEFPKDESTKQRFTQLVTALRNKFDRLEKLNGDHLLITSAVTARPHEGKWIDGPALQPSIDFLNVMTYDFSGSFTEIASHHAPLEPSSKDPQQAWRSTRGAMQYWQKVQGFPKHKLNVGIPLYGRQFPITEPYADIRNVPRKGFGTPEYKHIVKLQQAGWTVQEDAEALAPWLMAPDGKPGAIAFDNPESAQRKGRWAQEQGYRGIFFWALGHDYLPDGKHHVFEAAVEGWSN